MKKAGIFLFLFFAGCASFRGILRKSAFEIDESRFFYVNWFVRPQKFTSVINGVYDGDTVFAEFQEETEEEGKDGITVRLLGVDTPEIAHPEKGFDTDEPGAREAMDFTTKEVNWKKVFLVIDKNNEFDSYGRTLALVFYKDEKGVMRCLNWELIKRGYAKPYLWATDFLCNKKEWEKMGRIARLSQRNDYLEMARSSLKEKLPDDAFFYYEEGLKKFPNFLEMRKEAALIYEKLAVAAENSMYSSRAKFHWEKLLGTKFDSLAKKHISKLQ